MDWFDLFSNAPIWVKVDLVIIQLASAYAAARVLWIIWRRLVIKFIFMIKRFVLWIPKQCIWYRYHPVVKIIQRPTRIEKENITDSETVYTTRFQIEIISRDKEDTHISLVGVSLTAKQGIGVRNKKLVLSRDSKQTGDQKIIKPKNTSIIDVYVKSNLYSPDWKSNIDLVGNYRWKITGINISLEPAVVKPISFKGKM